MDEIMTEDRLPKPVQKSQISRQPTLRHQLLGRTRLSESAWVQLTTEANNAEEAVLAWTCIALDLVVSSWSEALLLQASPSVDV